MNKMGTRYDKWGSHIAVAVPFALIYDKDNDMG